PYISSTAANNGVDEFIGNDLGVRKFSNCLTIDNSGSVGACFFHHYEFVASDHVTHLKNATFSKYIYLFISAQLSKLSSKYNFNREINDKRIAREKVLLPINDDNQPDYEYMKQNMINLEFKKRKQYLIFIESKAENIKNLTVNECM
ncbi:restriction endonuclease subunit S, partial [Acinetobacter baumannii]|nr:restriction endonuclease subunit S [Acinetobacter baumannii]